MDLTDLVRNSKTSIVDVRTTEEFSNSRVEGSVNIPLNLVPENIKTLKKMQPLVLCCAAGVRSGQAMEFLKFNGLNQVYNGGSWQDVENMLNS
ncbi:MAG: rhodanese-like domain-containing protein [Flavobacteriales bacterium]|jgi:rhodanese-related sulfurtransferase|nr:rhodanese-like domain-containing protein [Flavobacteriales bacterium]|tara:strand:+ start:476 stop:754 length:279 start_codon:yes stop_codon:yes gene_type:complete